MKWKVIIHKGWTTYMSITLSHGKPESYQQNCQVQPPHYPHPPTLPLEMKLLMKVVEPAPLWLSPRWCVASVEMTCGETSTVSAQTTCTLKGERNWHDMLCHVCIYSEMSLLWTQPTSILYLLPLIGLKQRSIYITTERETHVRRLKSGVSWERMAFGVMEGELVRACRMASTACISPPSWELEMRAKMNESQSFI